MPMFYPSSFSSSLISTVCNHYPYLSIFFTLPLLLTSIFIFFKLETCLRKLLVSSCLKRCVTHDRVIVVTDILKPHGRENGA